MLDLTPWSGGGQVRRRAGRAGEGVGVRGVECRCETAKIYFVTIKYETFDGILHADVFGRALKLRDSDKLSAINIQQCVVF